MESVVKKVKGHCHIHGCKQLEFHGWALRFCKKCQDLETIELDPLDFQAFWRYHEETTIGWFNLYHIKNTYFHPKQRTFRNLLKYQLLGNILKNNVQYDEDWVINEILKSFDLKFKWDSW